MPALLAKRKRGRPHKENLLEGLVNLDTGLPPQEIPAPVKTGKGKSLLLATHEIVFWTGYGVSQVNDLKARGIIQTIETGTWDALPTFSGIIKFLRGKQQQFSSADKSRKIKADADTAELKAFEASGQACTMAQAKLFWSDNRIAVRQTIERAEYISKEHREKLLREIAALGPINLQRIAQEEEARKAAAEAPELPLHDGDESEDNEGEGE